MTDPIGSFTEREFYGREFRGRTLALALPDPAPEDVARIGPVLAALASAEARVVLLSARRELLDKLATGAVAAADDPRLEGEVWRRLRTSSALGLEVDPGARFATACRDTVARLGLFKLVWLDRGGGLRDARAERLSFVHLDELDALIQDDGAGLANRERLGLWKAIRRMLMAGLPAVNVCSAEGLDDELFSYAGSGTLFTRERYTTVRRLGIDDFETAADLIGRGVEEGYLAPRTPHELDRVLASAFGAFVEGHHLAGIGALLPGADGRSGEIASLYTITRFIGEGIGVSLVAHAIAHARERGLAYVFACTTSRAVGAFFERNGLREVDPSFVPDAKWKGYDPARRARVRCYRIDF